MTWEQRIARAQVLAERYPSSAEVLRFYTHLVQVQRRLFEEPAELSGAVVEARFPVLLDCVERWGSAELASCARELRTAGSSSWLELVRQCEDDFLARAFLEAWVATQPACPWCRRKPQVSVLRESAQGARRSLACALCQAEWDFERVICPGCGERGFDRLPVCSTPEFPHLRVEACDTCKTYLLGVDLSKDGHAVPCVDELAAIPLNLWAREGGYRKLQPNLLGL